MRNFVGIFVGNLAADKVCDKGAQADWIRTRLTAAALSDPDDEPLLQLAVEAKVPIIVTRNVRHLKPAETFGIKIMSPASFLAKLRKSK